MNFDKDLLEQCKQGDHAAQEKLYRFFAPTMLGICLRYAKNYHEAEDVMQEGFIKVFSNIARFRGEGSFEGWIKRIMVNTSLNQYYKNKRTQSDKSFDDIREKDIENIHEDEVKEYRFSQKEMLDAIHQLPDGYRQIFNMYVFEKYKHREIAELLNISVNTSKSQLSKARVYLKKLLIKLEENRKID